MHHRNDYRHYFNHCRHPSYDNGYNGYHRNYWHHRHDHRGESPPTGGGGDKDKVCVLHKNKGDDKRYRWVSKDNKDRGDKVVKDKFCEHKNKGKHKGNDHNAHANKKDDSGHANKKDDDNRGHANDDD